MLSPRHLKNQSAATAAALHFLLAPSHAMKANMQPTSVSCHSKALGEAASCRAKDWSRF